MSEKRWRANFITNSVDEIVIVNETSQFVDVESIGGWTGKTVRREAKVTSYSKICPSHKEGLQALLTYAEEHLASAERMREQWLKVVTDVGYEIAKQAD